MKKTITVSIFALILINCNEISAMLCARALHPPHRTTKTMKPTSHPTSLKLRRTGDASRAGQQRWCNKISPKERIEYIQALGGANYSIEKILDRNDQAIIIMLEQNRIGQQIISANLKSIGNLKNHTNHCEIYDITEGIELFDQLEKRLTKVDQPLE
jgi:hypothetical protein